jgi:cell wall-associated NlpC family hydrolase
MVERTSVPGRWPAVVAAARACVGTRFRLHGRTPGLGLDCVGVVLVAAAAVPLTLPALPAYRLLGPLPDIAAVLNGIGATHTSDAASGDILVIAPAPGQRHFGIVTPSGLVHAHAGLGRVVEGPIDPAWQVVQAWRLPGAR